MVRWIDGFLGGLIAGATSAAFNAIVSVAWLHDLTLGELFAGVAQALPPFHAAPGSPPLVALGVVLYLLVGGAFGVGYAALARRLPSTYLPPTSLAWGASYGLLVWWVLKDILVPLTGATDIQPLWEGLAGTIACYGIVLSELTALAHRRKEGMVLDPSPPGVLR